MRPDEQIGQMQLHWTCNSPSHYNDNLFQALHMANFADLIVHYRNDSLASHPWKTQLRTGYNNRIQNKLFGLDWFLIKRVLTDKKTLFVLGGWSDVTSILLILLHMITKRKYLLWTDTPNICSNRGILFSIVRNIFLRTAFSRASRILGTGLPALDALYKMGAKKEKLVNFPYWINFPIMQTVQNSFEPSVVTFVSSGRLINSLKGHDVAIRSFAIAFAQTHNISFEYLIAGTGPDAESLKCLANQLGIGQKVKFLGWLEPDELATLFCNSDVLVHPSPTHEPYGVAVIEAMAAGMVVMASDATCAARDRIKHGFNGFIHNAGNVGALSSQISWVLSHQQQLQSIKLEAKNTAEQWPVSRGVSIIEKFVKEIV